MEKVSQEFMGVHRGYRTIMGAWRNKLAQKCIGVMASQFTRMYMLYSCMGMGMKLQLNNQPVRERITASTQSHYCTSLR